MNAENKIILYPSNWLYNAGVVGLLKVLEMEKVIVDFTSEGLISLPKNLFIENSDSLPPVMKFLSKYITKDENINEWLNKEDKEKKTNKEKYEDYVNKYFSSKCEDGYRYIRAGGKWFFGSNTPYQNLIQKKEWENFEFVNLIKEALQPQEQDSLFCSFCRTRNIPKRWIDEGTYLQKRIITFADPHTDELGASIGKFPNSFWNNKMSLLICPLCIFIFIHHKEAFFYFNNQQIFINAPHFLLTYDLNKIAENILLQQKQYEIRKLLGTSLIHWAIKRRVLLGAWTMMNIEVIIKKKILPNKWTIDYYDLPYHITRILLDYEVANLIDGIGEDKIFDLILSGKFSELEKANYFVLRALLKLKNSERLSNNDPITKYVDNKEKKHLDRIAILLPELYSKIIKILKTEVIYDRD